MRYILCLIFCGLLLQGCSSRLALQEDAVYAYQLGDLSYANDRLTQSLNKSMPKNDFRRCKDAVCLLLDRATTRFADNDIEGSIADYNLAIESIDFYNQASAGDLTAQILFQDSESAYPGDDFEQVLCRIYFALALFHKGDFSNAQAILRQAEEWQQQKNLGYANAKLTKDLYMPPNPLAKYLFALLLEKRGDFSNADILYRQATEINPCLQPPESIETENATVLVVCHNGNVPQKYSTTSDASVVSMFALEMLLDSSGIPPACSSLVGIPVPAYWEPPYSYPTHLKASLGSCAEPFVTGINIAETAEWELCKKMPIIAARGAARILIRRATVGYMQERDPMLGAFADIGMLVINAATQADTRAWGTLPYRIDLARWETAPGQKVLNIEIPGEPNYQTSLNLKPGSLCVVNVFRLHPGVTKILIPEQFR